MNEWRESHGDEDDLSNEEYERQRQYDEEHADDWKYYELRNL